MKTNKMVTAVPLLLGIAFDLLFWHKIPGISFAIFTALCLLCGYLLLRSQKLRPARMSLALLVPILFFSVMSFVRREPFTVLLDYALTLACLAILAVTYRSGLWPSFGLLDYLLNFLRLAASMLVSGWKQFAAPDEKPSPGQHANQLWPILRGLLLAIPVLFIFGALLSSADLIFAQKINHLLANFNPQKLGEIIFRIFYSLMAAHLLFGVFSHAASRSQATGLVARGKPVLNPFLGYTEAAIILGGILLLFGAFVVIQFQYFFSGQANINLDGFTYSEYARRGFGELLAVAALSLLVFLGLGAITRRVTVSQQKGFSAMGIGLVALVLVILISSFQRLSLYEAAYGFSRLRAYAHVFIIWLGVLLVAVVVMEVLHRQRALATVALLILLGFVVSLNLLNVDGFIARQNVQRAMQGSPLDGDYLATLSTDAVPALVESFSLSSLSPVLKDDLGTVLSAYRLELNERSSRLAVWQSFNLSDWNAAREIEKVLDSIK